MKKLCVLMFFVVFAVFWVAEGCSPAPTSETISETQSEGTTGESFQEGIADTNADAGPTDKPVTEQEPMDLSIQESTSEQKTEPAQEFVAERLAEPVSELSAEPTQESAAEGISDGGGEGSENIADGGGGEQGVADGGGSMEMNPEAAVQTYTWTGEVFDFVANSSPVSGVKVCVYKNSNIPCVMTDQSGKFTLKNLVQNTDYHVTFEKSGLMPTMIPISVPAGSIDGNGNYNHRVGLLPEQTAKLMATLMGVASVDLKNKAHIAADVHDPKLNPLAGVSITMTPMSGQGPYYFTTSGTKNPKPETSSVGIGVFFNVDAGTYEFAYKHASKTCTAWPSTVKNANGTNSKAIIPVGWLLVTSGQCK